MCRKKTITISRVIIKKAKKEDAFMGWIRVPRAIRGDIENRSFIKVQPNNKTIFCQLRGTIKEGNFVEINEHYRDLFGVQVGQKMDLKITEIGWLFGKLRALVMHPDPVVRFAVAISLTSVILGILGFLIAILPASINALTSTWAWAGWVSLGIIVLLSLVVGYAIGLVTSMFTSKY
jgi:hypothetical protein